MKSGIYLQNSIRKQHKKCDRVQILGFDGAVPCSGECMIHYVLILHIGQHDENLSETKNNILGGFFFRLEMS